MTAGRAIPRGLLAPALGVVRVAAMGFGADVTVTVFVACVPPHALNPHPRIRIAAAAAATRTRISGEVIAAASVAVAAREAVTVVLPIGSVRAVLATAEALLGPTDDRVREAPAAGLGDGDRRGGGRYGGDARQGGSGDKKGQTTTHGHLLRHAGSTAS
jgi:hypothetical protein